jgi:CRP/FNR family transcriptional regulator
MITDKALEKQLQESFEFLQECDPRHYKEFLQTAFLGHLKKGQSICSQGSACEHLALILNGSARIYKLGENGREITLYRIGAGKSCILTASCIVSHQPFPAYAECEEDLDVVMIPAGALHRWMAESTAWRDYVFGLVAQRMADIISLVEEVVFSRVDRRIASYLLKRHHADNQPTIHATHQEIASDLGTSREVVSRILKDFEIKNLIAVARGSIKLLDIKSLEAKAEETA